MLPTSRRKRRSDPTPAIFDTRTADVYPSPENDQLYHPINPDDPAFVELVASIRERGVLEPIIITADGWIVSGHRRHAAARAAGLTTVPCRRLDIRRDDNPDEFVRLLREHNRQRVKTFDERMRGASGTVQAAAVDEGQGNIVAVRGLPRAPRPQCVGA